MAVEDEIYQGLDEEPDMVTTPEERLTESETNGTQSSHQSVNTIMERANEFVQWAEDRSVPIGSIEIQDDLVTVQFKEPIGKELDFVEDDDFQERFIQSIQDWIDEARTKAEKYEQRFRALDSLNLSTVEVDDE